jgi:hypothetical protein
MPDQNGQSGGNPSGIGLAAADPAGQVPHKEKQACGILFDSAGFPYAPGPFPIRHFPFLYFQLPEE